MSFPPPPPAEKSPEGEGESEDQTEEDEDEEEVSGYYNLRKRQPVIYHFQPVHHVSPDPLTEQTISAMKLSQNVSEAF